MFRLKYTINKPVPNHKTRKVLVVGNAKVGKSTFLSQLTGHPLPQSADDRPSAYIKKHVISDVHVDIQFINTADEQKFVKALFTAHTQIDYFIAVYDSTDLESLNYINLKISDIRKKHPNKKIILLGIKQDNKKNVCVSDEMVDLVTSLHEINSHYTISNNPAASKDTIEFISHKIARDLLDSSALSDDYAPPEFVIHCINKKIDNLMDDNSNTYQRTEFLRTAKAVTTSAQALLASEGIEQFEQHHALQNTLKLVYKVISEPYSVTHINALKNDIKTSSPGHSVLWMKLTGALTVFLGAAIIGLSAAGIPYTAGVSACGIAGGMIVIAAGLLLFRSGMQKSVAQSADRLVQHGAIN